MRLLATVVLLLVPFCTADLNKGIMVNATLEYSAKSSYQLKNMSLDSWVDLYNRMKSDFSVAQIYCSHYLPGGIQNYSDTKHVEQLIDQILVKS